jgi:cobalt-precorrin 5A hydrolase
MKIAVLSITKGGKKTAERVSSALQEHNVELLEPSSISREVARIFGKYDALVFVMATGIVVRAISRHIKDKRTDPAVVVLDEKGKFVISLLSGHLGGANELARHIAEKLNAVPVITTATDVLGLPSVEEIAKGNDLEIEDYVDVKKVNAAIVNGKKVGIATDLSSLSNLSDRFPLIRLQDVGNTDLDVLIVITNKKIDIEKPCVFLRPKNLIVGIGARRGISKEKVLAAIHRAFDQGKLSIHSLKAVCTPEFKAKEKGIIEASLELGVPLIKVSIDEIKSVEDLFEASEFVASKVGLRAVSEPCAMLGGKSAKLIRKKMKSNGVTVAVAEEEL